MNSKNTTIDELTQFKEANEKIVSEKDNEIKELNKKLQYLDETSKISKQTQQDIIQNLDDENQKQKALIQQLEHDLEQDLEVWVGLLFNICIFLATKLVSVLDLLFVWCCFRCGDGDVIFRKILHC